MQDTISLNDHYERYSIGVLGRDELEVLIFETIRKEIRSVKLPGWTTDDYEDYLSWLYPRINRAISTYRETGSSFETYIGTLMRLTIKEYRSRQARDYINETVAWNVSNSDMFAFENAPEYDEILPVGEADKNDRTAKNTRQVLILVLKCCNYVSADFLERISLRLGVEKDVLENMINRLKDDSVRRLKNKELLQEKINRLLCRCMVYEKNLPSVTDETAFQRLNERIERGRKRLAKMRVKLTLMRSDPSNSQIAQLLGISKSTVDSALHILKTRGNNTRNTNILN